jgi:hypothetical protein
MMPKMKSGPDQFGLKIETKTNVVLWFNLKIQ